MKYKNLNLIGTSHIAEESLREVQRSIEKGKPDIVALELDRKRLAALMQRKPRKVRLRDIRRVGIKGFLFSLIGAWAEKKLGEQVGVKPGSEMILAVKLAKKNKLLLALIDQDIEITLKRFSQELSWKEKWFFIIDIVKAVIFKKREVHFDLRRVPSQKIITKLIKKVRKRYPHIYKVLVTERNDVMARNLFNIMQQNPNKKILGIIGAGHEKEIINIIKNIAKTSVSYRFTVKDYLMQ
jgi:pheromone shutdown-related protein TraB